MFANQSVLHQVSSNNWLSLEQTKQSGDALTTLNNHFAYLFVRTLLSAWMQKHIWDFMSSEEQSIFNMQRISAILQCSRDELNVLLQLVIETEESQVDSWLMHTIFTSV